MAIMFAAESVNWTQSTWNHGFPGGGLGRAPASSEDWSWWTADQKATSLLYLPDHPWQHERPLATWDYQWRALKAADALGGDPVVAYRELVASVDLGI
jgi:hypothetical protein